MISTTSSVACLSVIIRGMKGGVDFIQTNLLNLDKIIRPTTIARTDPKRASGFRIEKSFVPEQHHTNLPESIRAQVEADKMMMKRQKEKQKELKAQLAVGAITRQEMQEGPKQDQKQPAVTPAVDQRITIDESGQVRDEQGNLLFLKNRTTALLINKKKDEEEQQRAMARKQKIKLHQRMGKSFLDRNLIVSSSKKRIKRAILGLQFLEKGSYQPVEHQKEVKEELQDLNDVFAEREDEVEAKIIRRRNKIALQFNRDIPKVEWWDAPLLGERTYQEILAATDETSLEDCLKAVAALRVEDVVSWGEVSGGQCYFQKVGAGDEEERVVLPMYLTKDQRKKLKRKRKHQKLLEKNDKIKLGLIEPDKPKLRVGNMAIVMKNEFVVDPSKIEAQARKQTEERVNRHLEQNSTRKLTRQQKKDKAIRKLKRDSAKECRRAVFRVARLAEAAHVFKVNMNAKQLALNGFVVKPLGELPAFPTMVMVEGGLRAVKFYKNLMLNRIRWSENDPSNCCKLVWEGEIENSSAGKWRVHEVGDEVEAIRILTEKKFESLWEYVNQ